MKYDLIARNAIVTLMKVRTDRRSQNSIIDFVKSLEPLIDWENLTKEEAFNLGFYVIDSELDMTPIIIDLTQDYYANRITFKEFVEKVNNLKNLEQIYLIPSIFYSIIPDNIKLYKIDGTHFIFNKNSNSNNEIFERFNNHYLTFGIIPKL